MLKLHILGVNDANSLLKGLFSSGFRYLAGIDSMFLELKGLIMLFRRNGLECSLDRAEKKKNLLKLGGQ